jgi:hypothetical protein
MNAMSEKSGIVGSSRARLLEKEISTFLIFLTNKIEPAQLSDSIVTKRENLFTHLCEKFRELPRLPQKGELYENTKLRFRIVTAADPVHLSIKVQVS